MKLKIALLVLLCFSVGIAQQKDKKQSAEKGKWEELEEYPKPINPIQPEYPQVAKLAGIQGKVFVEATISANGDVINLKVIKSDNESLNKAATTAVRKTKFTPGITKDGKKVKTGIVVPISFKLEEEKAESEILSAHAKTMTLNGEDPDINALQEVEKLPEMVTTATPEYPEEAKKFNATGKVYVKMFINEEGFPQKAVVIKSDNNIFNKSAVNAAMESKFSPAMQSGKPIGAWIVLPYNFVFDENNSVRDFKIYESEEKAKNSFDAMKKATKESKSTQVTILSDTDISYGDESFVWTKSDSKRIKFYSIISRKGNGIYKFRGGSLDEVKKYVEEMKASDQK